MFLKTSQYSQENLNCSLFLIKLQAWRPATLFKRDFNTGFFPANVAKFLRTPILQNICERLLLKYLPGHISRFIKIFFSGDLRGRNQSPGVFFKEKVLDKGVLKKYSIFTGSYLWRSLFLINLIQKRLQHRFFTVKLAKFLIGGFSHNTSGRLLLSTAMLKVNSKIMIQVIKQLKLFVKTPEESQGLSTRIFNAAKNFHFITFRAMI